MGVSTHVIESLLWYGTGLTLDANTLEFRSVQEKPLVLVKIVVFLYDRYTRDLIANSLRFAGYHVFAEDSAAQSWERIRSIQPQLVITDYPAYVSQEGSSNAVTLVDSIRTDAKHNGIPLISITSDPSPDWLKRAEHAGVTHSIVAPVDLGELLTLVRKYVAPSLPYRSADAPASRLR